MGEAKGEYGRGPGGSCVCTQCGYREPHQRRVPCMEKKCPNCGSHLMREEAAV